MCYSYEKFLQIVFWLQNYDRKIYTEKYVTFCSGKTSMTLVEMARGNLSLPESLHYINITILYSQYFLSPVLYSMSVYFLKAESMIYMIFRLPSIPSKVVFTEQVLRKCWWLTKPLQKFHLKYQGWWKMPIIQALKRCKTLVQKIKQNINCISIKYHLTTTLLEWKKITFSVGYLVYHQRLLQMTPLQCISSLK